MTPRLTTRLVLRRLRFHVAPADSAQIGRILESRYMLDDLTDAMEHQYFDYASMDRADGQPILDFAKWLVQYVVDHRKEIMELIALIIGLFVANEVEASEPRTLEGRPIVAGLVIGALLLFASVASANDWLQITERGVGAMPATNPAVGIPLPAAGSAGCASGQCFRSSPGPAAVSAWYHSTRRGGRSGGVVWRPLTWRLFR